MVRFKVIKGSHLLLAFAVVVFAAAIAYVALQYAGSNYAAPASIMVMAKEEAEALAAFASAPLPPLKIEIIPEETISPQTKGKILIYHTHTHEAYRQDSADPYEAVETWRTEDAQYSVVRLGSTLAQELRLLGYDVVHDVTDHEQDSINESYVRSLATLESYEEEFDLCIDLHRDAYTEGLKPCIENEAGIEFAQLMLLVGRGDSYTQDKPDYEGNLEFAQTLTAALNREIPDLCRNVTVKQGRYNQHIGRNNILVEVGHNQNTLQQALATIPYLAKSLDATIHKLH